MRKFTLIFLFLSIGLFAQDNIYKKNNEKIFAKVLEISSQNIRYKLPSPADTITHTIPKSEVAIIVFENGSSEVMKTPVKKTVPMADPSTLERKAVRLRFEYYDSLVQASKLKRKNITLSRKNYIYYNPFEILDGSVGLSYARNVLNNFLCIYVPVSVGFGVPVFSNGLLNEHAMEYKMDNKNFDAALGINFYPGHLNYNSPYIGIMYRYTHFIGQFNWNAKNNNFTLIKNYYYFTLGFRTRYINHFSFMANIHLGVYDNNYQNKASIIHYDILSRFNRGSSVNFSIQLGYNFK